MTTHAERKMWADKEQGSRVCRLFVVVPNVQEGKLEEGCPIAGSDCN